MKRLTGKTVVALGLSLNLKEKGYKMGYVKPIGKLPVNYKGETIDADALLFKNALALEEEVSTVSPFVSTLDTLNMTLAGKMKETGENIISTIKSIKDKDILLIAGTSGFFEGAVFGINGVRIVTALKAKTLIVETWDNEETIDEILGAKEMFGEDLAGVIINKVREESVNFIEKKVAPFLKQQKIEVFGMLPNDPVLKAVTVRTLMDALGGKALCAEGSLDELVKNYSIGAMDVNNAFKYFKMTPDKAVITGADRSDIQLAALETSTKCIILTGGLPPNDVIIGKAGLKGVPIISVKDDTFGTVNRIESIIDKLKIKEDSKVRRAKELVGRTVDMQLLLKTLGMK